MFRKFALSTFAVALGALLLVPLTALAEGESTSRISGLEERLLALEDQLQASQETITAQRELLQVQNPPVSQGGVDAFLQSVSVGGYVEASYLYDWKNPPAGAGTQLTQWGQPQNSFEFNAAKLELGRATDGSGTAGFQLDLLWGENAAVLSGGDDVWVQQAYVSYDYEGVELQMGRFETILGAEVIDTPDNYNVTRGLLFVYAIPLWHQGILASGDLGEGLHWKAGIVNGANNATALTDRKGILANVGMAQEGFGIDLNWYYGANDGVNANNLNPNGTVDNNDMTQIYDLVMTMSPSDETDLWLNADWGTTENPTGTGGHDTWKGISVGAAQQLSDKLQIAIRGEYFKDKRNSRGLPNLPTETDPRADAELWSATVTANYQVTDNLLARFEYRHDDVDASPSGSILNEDGFCGGDGADGNPAGSCASDRDIVMLDITYVFD
jgi:hypothetical protein